MSGNDIGNNENLSILNRLLKRTILWKRISLLYPKIDDLEAFVYNQTNQLKDMMSQQRSQIEEKTQILLDNRFSGLEKRLAGDDITTIEISHRVEILEEQQRTFTQFAESIGVPEINVVDEQFHLFNKKTFSQAGEDGIVAYIAAMLGLPLDRCRYIDIGANHAVLMNNTYLFYTRGSRGVLVEANEKLIPELKFFRSGDIILNNCIDVTSGEEVEFYVFDESADGLSTADKDFADELVKINPALKVEKTIKVKTIAINEILEAHFGDESPFLLSIDIEGKEMDILESINWSKYRPTVIIIEMIPYSTQLVVGLKDEKIAQFMQEHKYVEYAFTGINSIFIDSLKVDELLKEKMPSNTVNNNQLKRDRPENCVNL